MAAQAVSFLKERTIRGGTKVWTDGMKDWLPLHKCTTLFVGLEDLQVNALSGSGP